MRPMYSEKEFVNQFSPSQRIEMVTADGMWWTAKKLAKFAKIKDVDYVAEWLDEKTDEDKIIKVNVGDEPSYRMPKDGIYRTYAQHGISIDRQIIEKLFPPRIWNGISEVDGFEDAPLREVSTVKFYTENMELLEELKEKLKGLALVKKDGDNVLILGMGSNLVTEAIAEVSEKYNENISLNKRFSKSRRELVDFEEMFLKGLIDFYKNFSKVLLKNKMDTIGMFVPDKEDQESLFSYWVIKVIEAYDATKGVPFSGYLQSSIRWWPYDLPAKHLGNDLSKFQLEKSRAIKLLQKENGPDHPIENEELASAMDIPLDKFVELLEENNNWFKTRNATTISWNGDGSEERSSTSLSEMELSSIGIDTVLCGSISRASLIAAMKTADYESAFSLISKIDSVGEVDYSSMSELGEDFVSSFGRYLGGIADNG